MIILKRRKEESDGLISWKRNVQSERESRLGLYCSTHFQPDDFVRRLDFQEEEGILRTPWLKQDEFGQNHFSIDSCNRCWI